MSTKQLSTLIAGQVDLNVVDEDRYGRSIESESVVNLPACVNSDRNCRDFTSWQQAQDVLNAFRIVWMVIMMVKPARVCVK